MRDAQINVFFIVVVAAYTISVVRTDHCSWRIFPTDVGSRIFSNAQNLGILGRSAQMQQHCLVSHCSDSFVVAVAPLGINHFASIKSWEIVAYHTSS